jgi:hypothetical protein
MFHSCYNFTQDTFKKKIFRSPNPAIPLAWKKKIKNKNKNLQAYTQPYSAEN